MTRSVPAQISGDGASDGDVITWDTASGMATWDAAAGGAPSGAAGGVLSGTYPDPGFAADMATQAELDAHTADTSDAHDASAISFSPTGTIAATDVQAAIAEVASEAAGGYTDEQARDAIAAMIAAGTHTGISFSYNDGADSLSATATGGSSAIASVTAIGSGAGDYGGTSTTMIDVSGLPTAVIAAATNDVLIVELACCLYGSGAAGFCEVGLNIGGTLRRSTGITLANANALPLTVQIRYVVQSGDISAGNVTVKVQWKKAAGSMNMLNDTTDRRPTLIVMNTLH